MRDKEKERLKCVKERGGGFELISFFWSPYELDIFFLWKFWREKFLWLKKLKDWQRYISEAILSLAVYGEWKIMCWYCEVDSKLVSRSLFIVYMLKSLVFITNYLLCETSESEFCIDFRTLEIFFQINKIFFVIVLSCYLYINVFFFKFGPP